MIEAKDFLGNAIKGGDTICYPVRRGSRMWLKKMVVAEMSETNKGICLSGTSAKGRRINITNLENCIVVESR